MTSSTSATSSASAPAASPKKQKNQPQGLIRWGAVGPFVIVVALIYIYFAFFFDMHAKHLLQTLATRGNGAEVDISRVHTSFWKASLEIDDIQVTNHDEPIKNSIEIGSIRWHMLWDALLRGKIAIDEASILDIRIGTVRKTPGRVLPLTLRRRNPKLNSFGSKRSIVFSKSSPEICWVTLRAF